jgi:hypothetical protein
MNCALALFLTSPFRPSDTTGADPLPSLLERVSKVSLTPGLSPPNKQHVHNFDFMVTLASEKLTDADREKKLLFRKK